MDAQNENSPWGTLEPSQPDLPQIDLLAPVITIGRSDVCDIIVNNSFKISKEHCYLHTSDNCTVYLTDLSKNGTFINGKLIDTPDRRALLHQNDVIALGEGNFQVFQFRLKAKNNAEPDVKNVPEAITSCFVIGGKIRSGIHKQTFIAFQKATFESYSLQKISKKKYRCNLNDFLNVKHPFLANVVQMCETPSEYLLISEFIRTSTNLTSYVYSLNVDDIKSILYQVGVGLQHLHQHGIIHKYLKPKNILVHFRNNVPHVKITNYGLNKLRSVSIRVFGGLSNFLAPELMDAHSNKFDEKADVWSLGGVLSYMVFKKLPFIPYDGNWELPAQTGPFLQNTELVDLIRRMLMINSSARISVQQILDHPWLEKDRTQQRIELSLCEDTLDEPLAKKSKYC